MALKYYNFKFSWTVFTETRLICTGILKYKSAFSPATVIFET